MEFMHFGSLKTVSGQQVGVVYYLMTFPVIVDDYLPVNATTGNLIYGHCLDKKEMWVPLFEKAYAKLHGCYQSIESGTEGTAFLDLTGFPPEERCDLFYYP
jgi:hypothetical protein